MQRRRLILVAASAASLRVVGQPSPPQRAAVVIGVDRAGDLRPLRAAGGGARKVAAWLRREGFDPVVELVDDPGPVTAAQVFAAVQPLVDRGTIRQLVVYFAGHGFINGYSEHWMLSGAPDNPNEAVSLVESVALARQSGIPNVVFISDACRSRSDSLRTERVRGSLIFPNARNAPPAPADVDQFLATLVGDPSWEVPVDQSTTAYEGVYTATFLDAYRTASSDMVRTIGDLRVVPNAKLKDYLAREVPLRAARTSINLKQRPDTQVVSGELSYIGKYLPDSTSTTTGSDPGRRPDIQTIAQVRLGENGLNIRASGWRPQVDSGDLLRATRESGFDAATTSIANARGLSDTLSASCGFSISGAHIQRVIAPPGVSSDFENSGSNSRQSALVEVNLRNRAAASICIQFANGDGSVLAALDGFVGNVTVDESGVSNVSYVPARSSPLYDSYNYERERLERLHAVVAASARFGVFRIEASKESKESVARDVADNIRMLKGIDPTLGLYAAYAYFDAGLPGQVRSVSDAMRFNLSGTRLFDTAMLAGELQGRDAGADTVPFGPMLSQGWSLLRVKGVRLSEELAAMRDNMRNALWLTLRPEGVDFAARAMRSDRIR
jgi:hypothetical protein